MPFAQSKRSGNIDVTHVVIESTKPFPNVQAFLEALIPPIDSETSLLDPLSKLVIFIKRDHGELLGLNEQRRQAIQYVIGNPIAASDMTRCRPAAWLYLPVRVILYETEDGGACFEYDLPSSLFARFGDDRIIEIARALDEALDRAFTAAAE